MPPTRSPRVGFIRRGQAAGFSLAQIRQILDIRDSGHAPCTHVRDLLDIRLTDLDEQISALVALRETIARLRQGAESVDPESCSADDVCRYLRSHLRGTGGMYFVKSVDPGSRHEFPPPHWRSLVRGSAGPAEQ